jgi:hypothetical protein
VEVNLFRAFQVGRVFNAAAAAAAAVIGELLLWLSTVQLCAWVHRDPQYDL